MSLPESIGSAVEALRGTPGLLSVVLLQMATLGLIYIVSERTVESNQQREMELITRCFPTGIKIGPK